MHMPLFFIYYDSVEMNKTTKINLSINLPLLFTTPIEIAWPHAIITFPLCQGIFEDSSLGAACTWSVLV
jgi:hypothetical protein